MPNGSLDSHLFHGKRLLGWAVGYKIATGLASALLYLHEEWEQCVVHRDVKSSNVMLDSNFNAKLGDFGLARLVDHEHGLQTTVIADTMGYLAPECVTTGKASKEFDVNSFGVVALEIACGRRPVEPKAEAGKVMVVEWVWELYGRGLLLDLCLSPSLPLDVICPKLRDHLRLYHAWTFSLARHCLQSSHTSSPLSLPSTPLQCPALPSPPKSIKGALLLQQKDDCGT
ncbi:hypothetical protein AAC387_Pa03g3404 [Persea americana]